MPTTYTVNFLRDSLISSMHPTQPFITLFCQRFVRFFLLKWICLQSKSKIHLDWRKKNRYHHHHRIQALCPNSSLKPTAGHTMIMLCDMQKVIKFMIEMIFIQSNYYYWCGFFNNVLNIIGILQWINMKQIKESSSFGTI